MEVCPLKQAVLQRMRRPTGHSCSIQDKGRLSCLYSLCADSCIILLVCQMYGAETACIHLLQEEFYESYILFKTSTQNKCVFVVFARFRNYLLANLNCHLGFAYVNPYVEFWKQTGCLNYFFHPRTDNISKSVKTGECWLIHNSSQRAVCVFALRSQLGRGWLHSPLFWHCSTGSPNR